MQTYALLIAMSRWQAQALETARCAAYCWPARRSRRLFQGLCPVVFAHTRPAVVKFVAKWQAVGSKPCYCARGCARW